MRLLPRAHTRSPAHTQRVLPFEAHAQRRESLFKRFILAATLAVVVAPLVLTARGRNLVASAREKARMGIERSLGLEPERAEIEASWRRRRLFGIESTRATYRNFYETETNPEFRHLLDEAGMSPGNALFRWANYDWTVVLSSRVFEADESGRAYRMRPNVRSFWMRSHDLPDGLSSFFFIPDTPGVRTALEQAGQSILPESVQTTNSWGCRGAEPNRDASVRGLIVGDSFMQGVFVATVGQPPRAWNAGPAGAAGDEASHC